MLLEIAARDVYRPLWSSEILDEVDRAVRRISARKGADPDVVDAYVGRLKAQMTTAFPDALVQGWQPLVETIDLPDVNDRHVVAAAQHGRADVVVTNNRADFPIERLPTPLFTQTADTFLLDTYDLHPQPVLNALDAVADRTGRHGPKRTTLDLIDLLGARGCGNFAEAVARNLA